MPARLLLPLALVLAAVLAWLLVKPQGAPPPYPEPAPPREAGGETPDMRREGPGLSGSGVPRPARPAPPPATNLRPDQLPRGSLEVVPIGADGTPLLPQGLDVQIERVRGGAFWAPPVGIPDYESGVWSFQNVLSGTVKVTVVADHLLDSSREVDVPEGGSVRLEVPVRSAGALTYAVTLFSGEAPATVTVSLRALPGGAPVRVRWQVRRQDVLTAPRLATEVVQGPEGIATAIRPGTYRLRAVSPEGELEEADVEIVAGETRHVDLRIRR